MITIVEPKRHITDLWSKPNISEDEIVRLMRYVMRVDYEGKVLLHNVITGQLVALDQDETAYLDKLPEKNSSVLKYLIDGHFVVRDDFDEHQQVVKMRYILRKLDKANSKYITQYRIFPTTACNANCYYCFEQGKRVATMTEKTAGDVVEFISKNCGPEKKVNIMWFGGEPTVASQRIDQICKGLLENEIYVSSHMTTNGYLFDEKMVDRAEKLWHLKSVQITVDGTENNYNQIKSYANVSGSPYQRVLNNIGLLLEKKINVGMRMNFDIGVYQDFYKLVDEAVKRFGKSPYLHVSAFPIIGEYSKDGKQVPHGSEKWFAKKIVELNAYARAAGVSRVNVSLPVMRHIGCEADYDSAVGITPKGMLIRCGECYEESDNVGTIWEGVTNPDRVSSWKQLADYSKCARCTFFPVCIRLRKCSAKDMCNFQDRNEQFIIFAKQKYYNWIKKEEE